MILRFFLLASTLALCSFASGIQWMSLEQAKKIAQKEQKIVMVEISSRSCGYCTKMANTTFKDPVVLSRLSAGFASVLLYREDGGEAKGFRSVGTPTFFFLTPQGAQLLKPIFGAWESKEFLEILDLAKSANKEGKQ